MVTCCKPASGSAIHAAQQEIANTATHGLGLVLSLIGVPILGMMLPSVDLGLAVSCGVYLSTLVVVYAVSTLSHAVQDAGLKHLLRTWDQGLIYTLISGTYTPFVWAYLPPPYRGITMVALWTAALAGFYSKVVLQHRVNTTTTYSYVLLGWVPALVLMNRVSALCLTGMAVGGLIYTAGTLFLRMDSHHRYFHALWHVFVILGSLSHFLSIVAFVVLPAMTA